MKGILWDGQWHSRRGPGLPANAVTGNPTVRALLIGVRVKQDGVLGGGPSPQQVMACQSGEVIHLLNYILQLVSLKAPYILPSEPMLQF